MYDGSYLQSIRIDLRFLWIGICKILKCPNSPAVGILWLTRMATLTLDERNKHIYKSIAVIRRKIAFTYPAHYNFETLLTSLTTQPKLPYIQFQSRQCQKQRYQFGKVWCTDTWGRMVEVGQNMNNEKGTHQ
jgi:hypothetical protein